MVNNNISYKELSGLSGILKICPQKYNDTIYLLHPKKEITTNHILASIKNNYIDRIDCINVPTNAHSSKNNCFKTCEKNNNCNMASYKNIAKSNLTKCLLNKNINYNPRYPTKYPCTKNHCNTCYLYKVNPPKFNWMSNDINLISDKNVTTKLFNHTNDKESKIRINKYLPTTNNSNLPNYHILPKNKKINKWIR